MADQKFNLKNYVKISGDDHIEQRLRDETHQGEPNEISEKQLDTYRATEPDVLTEEQLERQRGGDTEDTGTTERRLDTQKSKFANSFRNPSAYEGDIGKLEEKRLANNPVEKEKYEDASTTPKGLRWWDNTDDPMGMKLAGQKNYFGKKAQFDGGFQEDLPEDVMEMIDEYSLSPSEEADKVAPEESQSPTFEEISQGSDESTGTPTYWGLVQVNVDVDERNRESIIKDLGDFLDMSHPELSNMKKRIDISRLPEEGVIEYTAAPEFAPVASNDFPIIVAQNVKKN